MIGRIPIRFVGPVESEGRWPAKAWVGEVVPFRATVFREGHGRLGAELLLTDPAGAQRAHRMRLTGEGTDLWEALAAPDALGTWRFRVRAWSDDWASWLRTAAVKLAAGQDEELTLAMGAELLARRDRLKLFRETAEALVDAGRGPEDRLSLARSARLSKAIELDPIASMHTESAEHELVVERQRAGVGQWYEFFPRSEGARRAKDGTWTSGTFKTAAKRLPGVAAMGFDVLYLPPIHPIGLTHRKGRNNAPEAQPGDPGSPWAVGGFLADGARGGHDAIHPDLGTLADFRAFVRKANELGIEIALDLALQASPDHPWVEEHPEWFSHRPDGTIAYAENPPKKYQDIYPLNFDRDPDGLFAEVVRILEHWIAQGVRIFRVDNPHTKPLDFWERLMADFRARHPDVVFLAEAFTRPAMLRSLADAGFQQSYTYFAWRNTKAEIEEFLTTVSDDWSATLRPNLWVNTPDILTEYLQLGGRSAYQVRAALAATGSPSWGVYAGYELVEHVARPGAEENIDNEKYEYKQRDWAAEERAGRSLAPFITRLNEIRAAHPALRQLRNLAVHWSDSDDVVVYSRALPGAFTPDGRPDGVVVVANVDSHAVRESNVYLDLPRLGLAEDAEFDVVELLSGARWRWGKQAWVRLDPRTLPVHILSIDYGSATR
ncbi:MAG: alpha-1,4-glucan--maltose-1-phosphate maltosyltransferase [Microbacteriaceae bacterium]|nr:alpha-1,4-glucan--maltose-1-phosphate maltosyltransferase [Microbacteriaceae bacterium]